MLGQNTTADAGPEMPQNPVPALPVNVYRVVPPERRLSLPRERLISRLRSEGLSARLTVICADAGYGKTTLLCDFCRATAVPVAWYRLDSTDRDITRFFVYLLESIRRRIGGSIERYFDEVAVPSATLDELVLPLVRQTSLCTDSPVVIVLDNYEKVNSSESICRFVEYLLEILPVHVHLFIASRERPNLPLGRLRASQDLLEIGTAELAFTDEEVRGLFARLHGLELTGPQLCELEAKMEGWAAGLVMALQVLRHAGSDRLMAALQSLSGSTRIIYDYLGEEVFQRQDSSVQDFLVKTAILPVLQAQVCDRLLGTRSAQQILTSLEDRGLFTHSLGGGRTAFRYHRLFREFLLDRLHALFEPEEVQSLHLAAARILEKRGDFAEAREQYTLAGDHDAAADVIERVAEDYLDRGMLETVGHWLRVTPERISSTRPWLLALHGKALRRSGDDDSARQVLERALALFREREDQAGQVWAAYELAFPLTYGSRSAEAVRLLEDTLAKVWGDRVSRARLQTILCLIHTRIDDFPKAQQAGEAALKDVAAGPRNLSTATIECRASRYLALAHAQQGQLCEAKRAVERAIQVCQSDGLGRLEWAWCHLIRGSIQARQGDWEAALLSLQEADDNRGGVHHLLAKRIGLWRGNICRDNGDFARAHAYYENGGVEALPEKAFLLVRQGRAHEALALAREVYAHAEGQDSAGQLAAAEVTLALALKACGCVEEARQRLHSAVATFRQRRQGQRLASAYLHIAKLDLDIGNIPSALTHLRQALDVAAKLDLRHFLWWDSGTFAALVGLAVKHNTQMGQVARILRCRLRDQNSGPLLALLSFPDAVVRDFAVRVLDDIASDTAAGTVPTELLVSCQDKFLGDRILVHVSNHTITVEELAVLHNRHGLTWREVDVFCVYYLEMARGKATQEIDRRACARRLHISENTLKAHIKSIRRKLHLVRRGGVPQEALLAASE